MPFIDRIYLTEVQLDIEGDVFFPEIDHADWQIKSEDQYTKDDRNPYDYTIRVLDRKSGVR